MGNLRNDIDTYIREMYAGRYEKGSEVFIMLDRCARHFYNYGKNEDKLTNKEDLIKHWMDIILAVFKAESSIPDIWKERLHEARSLPNIERDRVCDSYVRAIAEEILRFTVCADS